MESNLTNLHMGPNREISLQQLALSHLTTFIFNKNKQYIYFYFEDKLGTAMLVRRFNQSVTLFGLPPFLTAKLAADIESMLHQLIPLMCHSEILFKHGTQLLIDSLRWTATGAIDVPKTVNLLLDNNTISVEDKFQLCCYYCLEDKVISLWDEVSEVFQYHFTRTRHEGSNEHWIYFLKEKLSSDTVIPDTSGSNFYFSSVLDALFQENDLALLYFWPKVPASERDFLHANHPYVESFKAAFQRVTELSQRPKFYN